MDLTKLRPKAGWLLVEPVIEKYNSSLIILETSQRKEVPAAIRGKVLSLTPHPKADVFDADRDYGFKVGDLVMFSPFEGQAMPPTETEPEVMFIPIEAVMAVVED